MAKVEIRALENGPLQVFVDGRMIAELCRCGNSTDKPFCSGAHEEAGFEAPGRVIPVSD